MENSFRFYTKLRFNPQRKCTTENRIESILNKIRYARQRI